MFSKAKRFEPLSQKKKNITSDQIKLGKEPKSLSKGLHLNKDVKIPVKSIRIKLNNDTQSQCSSTISSKSFITPKPLKVAIASAHSTFKKQPTTSKTKINLNTQNELIKAQEVEIKNKDYTIQEYNKQIEEFRNKIIHLQNQVNNASKYENRVPCLETNFSKISLLDKNPDTSNDQNNIYFDTKMVSEMQSKILEIEKQCENLENEVRMKQMDILSLEEVITIRDSLCKDLQEKLTIMDTKFNETCQRLEMVNGHHALALQANESIRKEYKAELETLKLKFEEEKQTIVNKYKTEQDKVKSDCNALIDSIRVQITNEKYDEIQKLQEQLSMKSNELKAKLEQIDEASREKLRLCEIQFEERYHSIQEHYSKQKQTLQYLEKEANELKYKLSLTEEENKVLQQQIMRLKNDNELLTEDKLRLTKEIAELKEESKKKLIDFEIEINKHMALVDKVTKEKSKFEMSLSVTRDIVQVLTERLRESDNELEHLEGKVQSLESSKENLEKELKTYKNSLNNTVSECNEYKEALVNILKSKAALDKEHTRIMEHNVTLIESLQNVEKEAYRELGSIKNELIEDVESLRQESDNQIKHLREEVEQKRMLCELATEHAGQATAAAEQSRALLAQAASEITRLEVENRCFQQQIQDQQSLVVELSLLRQENEELTMTVAKQSSVIDKMKIEIEQLQYKPKSPSVLRKTHKSGKENLTTALSPLRERNY